MTEPAPDDLAETVKRACVSAALQAHEDAGIQGLCPEGRWEAAVSAMQNLDIRRLTGKSRRSDDRSK